MKKINLLKLYNFSYSFKYLIFRNSKIKKLVFFLTSPCSLNIFILSNNNQLLFLFLYSLPFNVFIRKTSKFSYEIQTANFADFVSLFILLSSRDSTYLECATLYKNTVSVLFFNEFLSSVKKDVYISNLPLSFFSVLKPFNILSNISFFYLLPYFLFKLYLFKFQ